MLRLASLVLLGLPLYAQTVSTQILGIVTDATGAVVPNAAVTAKRVATGDVRPRRIRPGDRPHRAAGAVAASLRAVRGRGGCAAAVRWNGAGTWGHRCGGSAQLSAGAPFAIRTVETNQARPTMIDVTACLGLRL